MILETLSPEIILKILVYLDFHVVIQLKLLSKSWNEFILAPFIWNHLPVVIDGTKSNFKMLKDNVSKYSLFIRKLFIKNTDEYRLIVYLIKNCTKIYDLHLVMCKVDKRVIRAISDLTDLTNLEFKTCGKAIVKRETDQDLLIDFYSLKKLKTLILNTFGLDNNNLDGLLECADLHSIDIKEIKALSQDKLIKFIDKKRADLTLLCLHGGDNFGDIVVDYIAKCQKLHSLFILNCQKLTDVSLRLLKTNRSIGILVLSENDRFTEKAMDDLLSYQAFSKQLTYLYFSRIRCITKTLVVHISTNCGNLKFVGYCSCPNLNGEKLMITLVALGCENLKSCMYVEASTNQTRIITKFGINNYKVDDY